MSNFPVGTRVRIINYQDGINGTTGTIEEAEERHAAEGLRKVRIDAAGDVWWLEDARGAYGLFFNNELEALDE